MSVADQSALNQMVPSGFSSAAQEFVLTFLLMMELIRSKIGNSIEVQEVFSRGRSENRHCLDQKTWTDGQHNRTKKGKEKQSGKGRDADREIIQQLRSKSQMRGR